MSGYIQTSKTVEWATPRALFDLWSGQYGPFDLDVCATDENAKCLRYFTREEDGLKQTWFGTCWMNPPYGKELPLWIDKAYRSIILDEADRVVCLLPARTDTRWWHTYVEAAADQVHFIKGRIKFEGATQNAPFPSVLVIF